MHSISVFKNNKNKHLHRNLSDKPLYTSKYKSSSSNTPELHRRFRSTPIPAPSSQLQHITNHPQLAYSLSPHHQLKSHLKPPKLPNPILRNPVQHLRQSPIPFSNCNHHTPRHLIKRLQHHPHQTPHLHLTTILSQPLKRQQRDQSLRLLANVHHVVSVTIIDSSYAISTLLTQRLAEAGTEQMRDMLVRRRRL